MNKGKNDEKRKKQNKFSPIFAGKVSIEGLIFTYLKEGWHIYQRENRCDSIEVITGSLF